MSLQDSGVWGDLSVGGGGGGLGKFGCVGFGVFLYSLGGFVVLTSSLVLVRVAHM